MTGPMNDHDAEDEDGGFDIPDVRPIGEIVALMRDLSDRAEAAVDDEGAADMFGEGLSLMLEIRVPREPDTDEELAAMLNDRMEEGPTFTMEEVEQHLMENRIAFTIFLERFDAAIASGVWNTAGTMLLPSKGSGAQEWGDGPYVPNVAMAADGSAVTTIRHGEAEVSGSSRIAGLSVLAAVMKAHVEWKGIWLR